MTSILSSVPSPSPIWGSARQLVAVASLWFGLVGCGGEAATSTADALDTTTTAPNSSIAASGDGSSVEGAVAADDLCAMHEAVGSSGFEGAGGTADIDALRVFAESAGTLSESDAVDAAIRPALRKLSDQAAALAEVLEANGGDMNDPEVTELQSSASVQSAYSEYGEWIDRNCGTEPTA